MLKEKSVTWTVVVTGNDSVKGADIITGALKANPDIRIILGTGQAEPLEDLFEPTLGELTEEEMEELAPASASKRRLAEKRRRAEQRLEELRLRDELGYYDLELDDF